jgi:predicted DNA-binding protein YlxM (UPF0122 family)
MLNGLKKWGLVAGMAVTAAAVLFAGGIVGGVLSEVAPALAQDEPVEELPCATRPGLGMGRGGFGGWLGGAWTMFDTAAEALGLTPQEFFAESHDAGKSLTEIAEERGIDIQAVYDAMEAARGEAMRERIQQAVEDGSMSQEQADWMLEGLDQGFSLGGRGFGHGFGGPMGPPPEE